MEFNKPNPLKMTGNLAQNFRAFRQEIQIYFDATESHSKKTATQVAILLNLLGAEGLKIYNTLRIKDNTVFEILKALEEYCIPRRNETMELYKFFTRKQADGEKFDKYYADLRELVKSCELGSHEDKMLKTQIILGIVDKDLQTKLLREDLNLEKVVKHCQVMEQSEINRKLIQEETKLIYNIEGDKQRIPYQYKGKGFKINKHELQQNNSDGKVGNVCKNECCKKSNKLNYKDKNVNYINDCTRCGKSHKINDCPAFGKVCGNCGLKNHLKIKCNKNNVKEQKQGLIDYLGIDDNLISIDALEVMCTENKSFDKSWIEKIKMNGIETEIKLDTGAEINVMPVNIFHKFKNIKLDASNVTIKSFGGYITKSKGSVLIDIKLKRKFEVVEYKGLPLLSYEVCVRMQFKIPEMYEIKSENKVNEKEMFININNDVFEGIGKFPDLVNIKIMR